MNPAETKATTNPPGAKRPVRTFLRWLERLLALIGLMFIIYHLGFDTIAMTSDSMAPALQGTSYENGDRVLLEKVSGQFRAPKRWEIYAYHDDDGIPVAKRVVGLPGEKIAIRTNQLFINGTALSLPTELKGIKYFATGQLRNGREVECTNGYFMLGDDSRDSYDSRFTGTVSKERFEGRALCVVWPVERVGFVD